ncbi:MAG: hypothetical protein A3F84_16310 [Candidatus Handelsmanbacteria bacterium RIFCSPLOWO2_12_FULL_64_10]|uniref:Uncharacterized protein n=1 Tax=Handelsmanbacteria sp. (strain RIFCSPLOWO2_12_FULL_64_10) TaxID=1817868 RepID=A0A1F6CH59_HANXR|nr:MAG: hypothetical protein A3F84_16310 [Candidatus Handelsmanbacteria bacterium RIFCSPLOWO2_12_FULL_64_10]
MKMTVLLVICVAVALVGVVVFFPVKIGCCRTCLVDLRPCLHPEGTTSHSHDLVNGYIYPYGLLWWGSLLMGTVGTVLLHRHFKGETKKGPEQERVVVEPQFR